MSVVQCSITINAPMQTVWRYLSEPDLLAGWLMRNNFSPTVGAKFEFRAKSNSDWDGVVNCKVIDFEPPEKLTFTWDANDIEAETLVTITLDEQDGKTNLRLIHSHFDTAPSDVERITKRHEEGWNDHLGLLIQQINTAADEEGVPENAVDWEKFDLQLFIKAQPASVLRYWQTIEGMEAFFVEMMRITNSQGEELDATTPASTGDAYIWRWHNGNVLQGRFLSAESENQVRFTFGDSEVSVNVTSFEQGTMLKLVQTLGSATEYDRYHVHLNCRAAWVYFLVNLRSIMEHSIDLRDKNRTTAGSFSTRYRSPV